MARSFRKSLLLGLVLGVAASVAQSAEPTTAQAPKEVKLGDCTVYTHRVSGAILCLKGDDCYYGTTTQVVPILRGEKTEQTDKGISLKFTNAKSGDTAGVLVYCGDNLLFFEPAGDAMWSKLSQGKDTMVSVCPNPTGDGCPELALPCKLIAKTSSTPSTSKTAGTAPKANGSSTRPVDPTKKAAGDSPTIIRTGGDTAKPRIAAPGVTLIEGETVRPEEAMVFTRSMLLEEGPAISRMSEQQENIDTVRFNMNSYRLGYALPAKKDGERFVFNGPVKAWRAQNTADVSIWPVAQYPASRNEAMRRAKLLDPIGLADECDEMKSLRVYYFHSLVGHDGREYKVEPTALAFFIHPTTGQRMTVLLQKGRTYGSVNVPLASTTQLYISDTQSYKVPGTLGLGRAHVPSVFYGRSVKFDTAPFAEGDNFDGLMKAVMEAHKGGTLATDDFKALFNEMCRYTGGKPE